MTDDEILNVLVSHGVPGAAIIRVAQLVADAKSTHERREKNRERMRSVRARVQTCAHTDAHENTRVHNSSSLIREESKKEEDKKESKKERPKYGTRIPADWQPSEADRQYASSKGMSQVRIDTEAEKFRNYWTAKTGRAATKLDWAATWRNWCLQSLERIPPEIPPDIGKPKTAADWGWRPGLPTHEELLAKERARKAKNGNGASAEGQGVRHEGNGVLQDIREKRFPHH